MWRLGSVVLLVILSSLSEAQTQSLTLEAALEKAASSHPINGTFEPHLVELTRTRADLCQEQLQHQYAFSPPQLSCTPDYLLMPVQRQRLVVLRRMLDVFLADQRAVNLNEAMAIAFVDLNKVRSRFELGERSSLDVSALNRVYQQVRAETAAADRDQRLSRILLAEALGAPDKLVEEIELPNFHIWLASKLGNKEINALDIEQLNPMLKFLRAAGEHDLTGLVTLQLRRLMFEIQLALEVLKVSDEAAAAEIELRDLLLDKNRVLYELDVSANLGDAMVLQSRAVLNKRRIESERIMLRAMLSELTGVPFATRLLNP